MAATKCDAHPVDAMLAISDVITNPRLARLYTRTLERGDATVDELAAGLESSSTTVYEDVNRLTEMGLLERVTEAQPHRYRASPVSITVRAGDDTDEITAILLVAVARSATNQNLEVFLDRHGVSGLATATEYARQYVKGEMTSRIMARELDLSVLEAETVLQELREIILEFAPDVHGDDGLDLDALDGQVGVAEEKITDDR